MNNISKTKGQLHLRKITAVSLICALAYICVFLIRFKVSFLTFDLKDAIMAIGSMYFGPVSALVIPAVVSLIEFLTISDTGVYGLIMNFLASASFCLVASVIYRLRKTISGAIISLVSAAVVMTGVMILANLFITPYYMGVAASDVRAMIPTLFFPFNLIKGVVNGSVVMLLYKHFSRILKASGVVSSIPSDTGANPLKKGGRVAVGIISLCILVLSLLVLFLVLRATLA